MTDKEVIRWLRKNGAKIGRTVGFEDFTDIHSEWIEQMVFGKGDYTLMAHRGAFKSSCLAVAIALMMILYPQKNIIFLRKADNDVSEMLRMVKKILQTETMATIAGYFYDMELKITEDAQDRLSTSLWRSPMGSPQLLGLGIKSSITGKHAEFVITDDICNVSDRISKAERERTKLQYQELQNIENRGGRIINLGTKWHRDDVFSLMPNIHVYDYHCTGLITDEKIAQLKQSMTPALFAANYELKIVADEDVIFSDPKFIYDPELVCDGYSHVDAAYGGGDSTAFTVMSKKNGNYYIYGKLWHRHVDGCMDEICKKHNEFRCGKMWNENNGDKGYLAKEFRKRDIRCISYHEDMNKYLKITTYLVGAWQNVYFLEGTDKEYLAEILDYNENAEHDDAPDSCASLIRKQYWKKNEGEELPDTSYYGGQL